MLKIVIPKFEGFDEQSCEFIEFPEMKLQLEHSLVSLSKWESKWKKPFLSQTDKRSMEELKDYVRCMSITPLDENKPLNLTTETLQSIKKYIEDPMTATTFYELNSSKSREIITSELIYYWMISLNIPMECQKWHLNRLLTLIRVCSIKNAPEKEMSQREIMARNRALNAQRKAQLKTRG